MIAKRIMAPKGGAGFGRLGAYVLNARRDIDPASWTRLNAYILDTGHAGEKVAWARVSHCLTDDPGWAVKEILATQAGNTRSRSDKSYHLVVSFPEGERPTREQIEDLEDRLCAAIGFAEHQRVSAVHQNTDNWHLHVAINKVHPRTFRNVMPVRDHYRLQEACAELEVRHGLTRENHTIGPGQAREGDKARGRAADFEARHGGQSFLAWVREHAALALLAARDSGKGWPELHRVAAAYDLDLRPRGAGLVIGQRGDKRLHVKASDVDRGLSLPVLTAAFGPYIASGQDKAEASPKASYPAPGGTGPLYEDFRRRRAAAVTAREAAVPALRERHRAYGEQLRAYHCERLRQERLSGRRGMLRRDALRHLAEQRQHDHAERREREAAERRQLRAQHALPSWQGFLEAAAAEGNEDALATLRARQRQRTRFEAALLEAAGAGEVRHVMRQHLRPAVRRDGRVVYRVADGGLVMDEARQVRVSQATDGAALLALSLAKDRFGSRPLRVQGTGAFRRQVAEVAGRTGLGVTFADGGLEKLRRNAAAGRLNSVDRSDAEAHDSYNIRNILKDRDRSR